MPNRTSKIERLLIVRNMSTASIICLLRMKSLLSISMTCPHCQDIMKERHKAHVIDGVCWACYNKNCSRPLTTLSIRAGSFFADFRLSLADLWTVILMWSEDEPVCKVAERYGISRIVVKIFYDKLRSIISLHLSNDPIRLGGPGTICQIDESLFSHKQKYHRGRIARDPAWVFGVVDTTFKPAKGYMEVVDNRSADVLLPIINRVCRPGTVIHSDEWAVYRQIQNRCGLSHRTVNHSVHFVDPNSGVHTQHIESYWARMKQKIKAMKGASRSQLQSLLDEFMWKDNLRERILLSLVGLLRAE